MNRRGIQILFWFAVVAFFASTAYLWAPSLIWDQGFT